MYCNGGSGVVSGAGWMVNQMCSLDGERERERERERE